MMSPGTSGAYSDKDYEAWNESLARLERARHEIELALEAGIPCQEDDAMCKAVKAQLERLKRVYFPGRP